MTDETKKLFDAPFAVMGDSTDYTKFNVIIHSRKSPRYCSTVASCIDQKTAIRFARLPELYDALVVAAKEYCPNIKYAANPLEACDNCGGENCAATEWLDLLRKVKEGK